MFNCKNCWDSCPLNNIELTNELLEKNNWVMDKKNFKENWLKPCAMCVWEISKKVQDIYIINLK